MLNQLRDISTKIRMHVNLPAHVLQSQDFLRAAARAHLFQRLRVNEAVNHSKLLLPGHCAHADLHQETVQLRFRKWKSPQCLNRVLSGDHKKRFLQRPGRAVDRHLPFRHTLEKGGLCAGRRAVDLIRKEQIAKDRTRAELKSGDGLVKKAQPGHITRKKVRRKLNPGEFQRCRRCQAPGQDRLSGSRHVFNQRVAAGGKAHKQKIHRLLPADDDLRDVFPQHLKRLCMIGHGFCLSCFYFLCSSGASLSSFRFMGANPSAIISHMIGTIFGSNWVPAFFFSSFSITSSDRPGR